MVELKITQIKGRPYVEVSERVKFFRKHFQGWNLITKIIEYKDDFVLMQAIVINQYGVKVATGTASEKADSNVNKLSMFENCETAAMDRDWET